ncbi:MAG: antitoxin Xre/MbcA/ParS toxin-binding domain-containing protein [Nitrospirota bacterium]
MQLAAVEKILGGKKILHKRIQSRMDFINLRVTKNALMHLAKAMNLPLHQVAKFLPVTLRTVQRYKSQDRFSKAASEHILIIAEVMARGLEVFEDKDNFLKWLNLPCKALGNSIPIDLLSSKVGADIVSEELGRIEHGIFA